MFLNFVEERIFNSGKRPIPAKPHASSYNMSHATSSNNNPNIPFSFHAFLLNHRRQRRDVRGVVCHKTALTGLSSVSMEHQQGTVWGKQQKY